MICKLLTCCLLAIFFSTSVVGNLAWAQSLPAEIVITAKRLNVRDDIGGSKLGAVFRGQQFELKGTKENWGKIEFEPGRLGWISLQYSQPVARDHPVVRERGVQPVVTQSATLALSQTRLALVIGNSDYTYAGVLRNPVNDAMAIAQALEQLGFEVITVTDGSQKKMERSIRDFGKQLKHNKGMGLFYFAGHGMQFDGENYLLPTDIDPSTKEDVRYDAVPLGKLLAQMRIADNGLNIVVLDACRNNPFARSFRNISGGLTQVVAPSGTFISYATAPGSVAADGNGKNGLFTAKLLKHMRTPGLKLEDVFKEVRIDVRHESGGHQVPWDSSTLTGDFYFVPPADAPPAVASLDLGDLQEQADAAEQARLEKQRLEQARLEEQRLEQVRQEQARLEKQRIQTQWQEWQQKMQQDYDKVTAFEQQAIENHLKVESWERFLSSWKNDNPYSEQDTELRSKAQERIIYWQKEIQQQKTEQQVAQSQENNVGGGLFGKYALKKLKETKSCENCDLQGANLESADLSSTNLQNADLSKADLWKANLKGVKLKGAKLYNANLGKANLEGANLEKANLEGAKLWKANLKGAKLRNAKLEGARLENAKLSGAKFCNTTMPNGSINNRDC